MEVAVTVASESLATLFGAVYVTEVKALLLNVPGPESDQVTPLPLESADNVMFNDLPALRYALAGESVSVAATPTGVCVPLLPHPIVTARVPTKAKTDKLRTVSSLL